MGLVDTIRGGIDSAWAALGDLVQPVTYRRSVPGAYDPSTQRQAQVVTATTIRAILTEYDADLVAKLDVRTDDSRLIIRAKDLPFEPDVGDTVQHGATTWTVVAPIRGDPRFHWDLTLRK